jgi:hypothetical protein
MGWELQRVVACWLQVQHADIHCAQRQNDLTLKQADFHQRRMDAANRRLLSAIKALAVVCKLAIPALQINVARRLVNVVAPAVTAPTG